MSASIVVLEAGGWRAEFEEGGLRYIAYNGTEIVRGLYAAVRDRDWGTVPPQVADFRMEKRQDGVDAQFHCVHLQGDIDFEWRGAIRMRDRSLQFDFDGKARSAFLKNRIGFCLLHPMSQAGACISVTTDEGIVTGRLPIAVSAHQPYRSIRAMRIEAAESISVGFAFEGDVFEMEDQRNWTDASFKTYCTPLDRPFPAAMKPGDRVRQSVRIDIEPAAVANVRPASDGPVRIDVGDTVLRRLPEIGIGLPAGTKASVSEEAALRELRPSFLRFTLDLRKSGWERQLEEAAGWAARYRCSLELELLCGEPGDVREAVRRIAAESIPVTRLIPFAGQSFVTDEATLKLTKRAVEEAGAGGRIETGGGSRAYYAEHNRAWLPAAAMDFTSFTVNPQVHAFDDRSVMETLTVQAVLTKDAYDKTRLPVSVGPITLKPRLNPNAASGDGALSIADRTDPRQREPFAAAWTLGSLCALCNEGAGALRSVSYFELSGPLGLVDGAPFPVYFVFKDVMDYAGADVLAVSRSSEDVCALALRREDGSLRLLLANLTGREREVDVRACGAVPFAWKGGARLDQRIAESGPGALRTVLPPYGYVSVDLRSSRAE